MSYNIYIRQCLYNDGLYDETVRRKKYIHLRNFTFGILLIYTYIYLFLLLLYVIRIHNFFSVVKALVFMSRES